MMQDFQMLDPEDKYVFCDVLTLRVSKDLDEQTLWDAEIRVRSALDEQNRPFSHR